MNSILENHHLRSGIHYLAAIFTMGIYGGQVCPLAETLRMGPWLIELSFIFILFFILRTWALNKIMGKIALQKQVGHQFLIELAGFIGAGMAIIIFNKWVHGFPGIESGLKMLLGTTTLGFFIATDLALLRERNITQELLERWAYLTRFCSNQAA
ncbi:MAG: hypothetical protein GY710_17195 [Desulfobacteraceae bacterium]|nr:hypothetical protein [Desulfobacteraceae bacterium]